jgi:hypothetical protein
MGSLVGLCWTRQFDLVVLWDIDAVEYIGLAERFQRLPSTLQTFLNSTPRLHCLVGAKIC